MACSRNQTRPKKKIGPDPCNKKNPKSKTEKNKGRYRQKKKGSNPTGSKKNNRKNS